MWHHGSDVLVWIVRHDPNRAKAWKALLEARGHTAIVVSSAAALRAAAAVRDERVRAGTPDATIVEGIAAGGFDLATSLRDAFPRMRLVMVSGPPDLEPILEALLVEASEKRPAVGSLRAVAAWPRAGTAPSATMDQIAWTHMCDVLAQCGGNRTRAAQRLGISRATLQRMLKRGRPRRRPRSSSDDR